MTFEDAVPAAWRFLIREWAARQPRVAAIYVFGSRAKLKHHADSDIDLAVIMDGCSVGEQSANWMFRHDDALSSGELMLPVRVDMWPALESDEKVMPAVREHGRLLYERRAIESIEAN